MDRTDVYAMCPACGCVVLDSGEVQGQCGQFETRDDPCEFAFDLEGHRVYAFRLVTGEVCLIDFEDKRKVWGYSWRTNKHGHVVTEIDGRKVFIHRLVTGAEQGDLILDHVFGDKLDNRKSQLRVATSAQNRHNTPKVRGSSAYIGVYFATGRRRWVASIQAKDSTGRRRNKSLGTYDSEVQAAEAYDAAARDLYGEFARLNFPRPSDTTRPEGADPALSRRGDDGLQGEDAR